MSEFLRLHKRNVILLIISFICSALFFYQGLDTFGVKEGLFKITGDSVDYIESVENLLNGNGFTFPKTNEDRLFVSNFNDPDSYNLAMYYSFRSPGFAIFYTPLRFLFGKERGLTLFIVLQLIVTSIAKLIIAKIGEKINDSLAAFYILFIVVNITPFFTQYNNLLLTEAFGFSFLVFSIYYFAWIVKEKEYSKTFFRRVVMLGFCLTIAIMLRPFLAIFLAFIGLYFTYEFRKEIKKLLFVGLLYSLPFLVLNGSWVIRNYIKTNEIVPLASTIQFLDHKHKSLLPLMEFCHQHGVPDRWFHSESPVNWIVHGTISESIPNKLNNLSEIDIRFLKSVKLVIDNSFSSKKSLNERKLLEESSVNLISRYNESYKKLYPTKVSWVSPIKATLKLLRQPNIEFFHHIKYPFNVVYVLLQSSILSGILILGVLSLLLVFIFKKLRVYGFITLPSLVLIYFFGFVHQSIEYRELYTFSFIGLLILVSILINLLEKSKRYFITLFVLLFVVGLLGYWQMLVEIKW